MAPDLGRCASASFLETAARPPTLHRGAGTRSIVTMFTSPDFPWILELCSDNGQRLIGCALRGRLKVCFAALAQIWGDI